MPLSDKALEKRDAGRDIGEELLQSVRQMKKGRKGKVEIEFYSDDDLDRLLGLLT